MREETLWQSAVRSLDKHKAADIVALRVAGLTAITDHFILATGGSATQVRSLADYLEEELGKEGFVPLRSEGYNAGDWITLDYGDAMVHIFRREIRDFYALEHLWTDAPHEDITPFCVEEN